jgi:hypothetical protein
MKKRTKQMILGFAVAPLAIILVNLAFSIFLLIKSFFDAPTPEGTLVFPNPQRPWEFVLLFSLYGIPAAYFTLCAIWYPTYCLIRRMNKVSILSIVLLAAACSLPAILLFGSPHSYLGMAVFLIPHGLAVSLAFLWLSDLKLTNRSEPVGI